MQDLISIPAGLPKLGGSLPQKVEVIGALEVSQGILSREIGSIQASGQLLDIVSVRAEFLKNVADLPTLKTIEELNSVMRGLNQVIPLTSPWHSGYALVGQT